MNLQKRGCEDVTRLKQLENASNGGFFFVNSLIKLRVCIIVTINIIFMNNQD